ncbi:MAG: hypothetical protein GX962_11585 [Epulopiscium sp.]|nr:hypothetical protein [Candidatus Epulonipiscium sp.]
MAKIMIDEKSLEEFSQALADIQLSIKAEVNSISINREKIYDLIDNLNYTWKELYNPAEKALAKSMRSLYGRYIHAMKSGELEKADQYLKDYLRLKSDIG